MREILEFLMDNLFWVVFVVLGILGNLGSSTAKRQQQQRERERKQREAQQQRQREAQPAPWEDDEEDEEIELEPVQPATQEDEIARRIREVLGQPQQSATTTRRAPAAAPTPPRTPAKERDRGGDLSEAFEEIEQIETFAVDDLSQASPSARRGTPPAAPVAAVAKVARVDPTGVSSDLGQLEGMGLTVQSMKAATVASSQRAAVPPSRGHKLGNPRDAVLSMLLLGPPRALTGWDDDPTGVR